MFLLSPLHFACQNIEQVATNPKKHYLNQDLALSEKKSMSLISLVERLFDCLKMSGKGEEWALNLTLKAVVHLGNIASVQQLDSKKRIVKIIKIAEEALHFREEHRIELLSSFVHHKEYYFLLVRIGCEKAKVDALNQKMHQIFQIKNLGENSSVLLKFNVVDPITHAIFIRYRNVITQDHCNLNYIQLIQHLIALKKLQRKYNESKVHEVLSKFILLTEYSLSNATKNKLAQQIEHLCEIVSKPKKVFQEVYYPGRAFLQSLNKNGFKQEILAQNTSSLLKAFKKEEDLGLLAYAINDNFESEGRPRFLYSSGCGQSPKLLPSVRELESLFEYGIKEEEASKEPYENKQEAAAQEPFAYPKQELFTYSFHERVVKRANEMLDFPTADKKPEAIFKSQEWRHGFPPLEPFLGTEYSIQDTYHDPETKRKYLRFIISGQVELTPKTYEACEFQFSFCEIEEKIVLVHRYVIYPKQNEILTWINEKQVFLRFEMPSLKELAQMEAATQSAKELKEGNKMILQQDDLLGMITCVDSKTGLTFRIFKVR